MFRNLDRDWCLIKKVKSLSIKHTLVFHLALSFYCHIMSIDLDNVSFVVNTQRSSACVRACARCLEANDPGMVNKDVLHNISIRIPTGTLTAIVGLAGSGKRTLSRIIAGEQKPTHGSIRLCDAPKQNSIAYFDRDTPLHEALTVYETLYFWVCMSNSAHYGRASCDELVHDLIRAVQLEQQEHVRVFTLSESERMRVRLAMLLATHPRIIVVDGLTAFMSAGEQSGIFLTLKQLADRNKCTIVLTMHHVMGPLLSHFHFLVVLAAGRRLYAGPVSLMTHFFTKGIHGQLPVSKSSLLVDTPRTHVVVDIHKPVEQPKETKTIQDRLDIDVILERLGQAEFAFDERTFPRPRSKSNARTTISSSAHQHATVITSRSLETEPDPDDTSKGDISLKGRNGYTRIVQDEQGIQNDETEKNPRENTPTDWTASAISTRFDTYEKSPVFHETVLASSAKNDPEIHIQRIHLCTQLAQLMVRFARTHWRSHSQIGSVFASVVACLLLNTIVWSSTAQSQMANTLQITNYLFVSLFVTILIPHARVDTWIAQRQVLQYEMSTRIYSVVGYMLAHTLFSVLENTILCGVYVLITYRFAFVHPNMEQAMAVVAIFVCHTLAHSALLESVVMVVPRQSTVHMVMLWVASVSFAFAGFMVPIQQISPYARWIYYLSYTQYAFQGLMNVTFPTGSSPFAEQLFAFVEYSVPAALLHNAGIAVLCRIVCWLTTIWFSWNRTVKMW